MKAFLHPSVPLDDYVRDTFDLPPSLSASVSHRLLTTSPYHAHHFHPRLNPAWVNEATAASERGTIAHALLLEGKRDRVVIVNAETWAKKDATDRVAWKARDEIRAAGNLPVLAGDMPDIEAMVTAARTALDLSELAGLMDDGGPFGHGQPEGTLVWQESGAWCRSRPDWISGDRRILLDYKTVGRTAEPDGWARGPLLSAGHDLQAAFGIAGLRALGVHRDPTFVFMVQEVDPPYACSFVSPAPAYLAWAEAKRQHALTVWADCLARDDWPSYPRRIVYAEPPQWAVGQWNERQTLAGLNEAEEGIEAL